MILIKVVINQVKSGVIFSLVFWNQWSRPLVVIRVNARLKHLPASLCFTTVTLWELDS